MTVLVTGGAGFIGSAVVRRLIGGTEAPVNLDALTYAGNPDSVADAAGDHDEGVASNALAHRRNGLPQASAAEPNHSRVG